MTPAEKIRRDIEDQIFGPDVYRHDGTVERGVGSAFLQLPATARAHIEAADDLIAAERQEKTAGEELYAATVKHDQAVAALAAARLKVGASSNAAA